MISGHSTQYRRIHFTSGNALFLSYLSVIIGEGRVSQRPSGHASTCYYISNYYCCCCCCCCKYYDI